MQLIHWAERGWIPDSLIRLGIRQLLRQRLHQVSAKDPRSKAAQLESFAAQLRDVPLVVAADDANSQHYEVPAEFFQIVLGKHLKYSSVIWPLGVETLDAAEESMLKLTVERAEVQD